MIVLGEEAVGKTSLINAIVHNRPCSLNEPKTPGVRHQTWVTPWSITAGGSNVQLNIWDFGGQTILQQTHRYFLSQGCLYLVVLDRRLEDDTSVHDWLHTIETRAPGSPIVVAINKCDDGTHNLDLDVDRLQRDHPDIVGVLTVSCSADESEQPTKLGPHANIAALRALVKEVVESHEHLDSARRRVPKSWIRVRDEIRSMAELEQVLERDRYTSICAAGTEESLRVDDPDEQRALLEALDQIGVVVAHGVRERGAHLDVERLLDPNWLTDAVYAMLSSVQIHKSRAVFDHATLGDLLRSDHSIADRYPDQRVTFVIDMLCDDRLSLAFQLPDGRGPVQYLMPEALPTDEPPDLVTVWSKDSLHVRYRYEQLPRGIVPQLQVATHALARTDASRWRAGFTLRTEDCNVLVRGFPELKYIDIRIAGAAGRRHEALAVVKHHFDQVHLRSPEIEAQLVVPDPDSPNHDFGYDQLRNIEERNGPDGKVQSQDGKREYRVGDLLESVRVDKRQVPKHQDHPATNPVASVHIVNTIEAHGGTSRSGASGGSSAAEVKLPPQPPPVLEAKTGRSAADLIQVWGGIGALAGAVLAVVFGWGREWDFATLDTWSTIGLVAAISALFGTAVALAHWAIQQR